MKKILLLLPFVLQADTSITLAGSAGLTKFNAGQINCNKQQTNNFNFFKENIDLRSSIIFSYLGFFKSKHIQSGLLIGSLLPTDKIRTFYNKQQLATSFETKSSFAPFFGGYIQFLISEKLLITLHAAIIVNDKEYVIEETNSSIEAVTATTNGQDTKETIEIPKKTCDQIKNNRSFGSLGVLVGASFSFIFNEDLSAGLFIGARINPGIQSKMKVGDFSFEDNDYIPMHALLIHFYFSIKVK